MKKFTSQEIKEFVSKPMFDEWVLLKMTFYTSHFTPYTSRAYALRLFAFQLSSLLAC
jgi:hypothetical protein